MKQILKQDLKNSLEKFKLFKMKISVRSLAKATNTGKES